MTIHHIRGYGTKRIAETGLPPVPFDREEIRLVGNRDRKQWKRLRRLNHRYRKMLRKQQQLRAVLMRLRKDISDVKQEIVDNHRIWKKATGTGNIEKGDKKYGLYCRNHIEAREDPIQQCPADGQNAGPHETSGSG